jgi:two-component system, response regulator PdtaR
VLVVEDEILLRITAIDMIEEAGFETVEAGNAAEAIAILENHSNIRVIFTDIQMPGAMDGLKLAAAVRRRWPLIQIIATSGRSCIGEGDLPKGGLFLTKPYTLKGLSFLRHALTGGT